MSDDARAAQSSLRRFLLIGTAAFGVLAMIALAAAMLGSSPARAGAWHGMHRGGDADRHERFGLHADFAAEWLLRKVDASEDQQAQVKQILAREIEELQSSHDTSPGGHERLLELFAAEQIDSDAVEALRSEQLQMADEISEQLAETLIEIGGVLTQEQRRRLVELAADHHERRMFGRHRWH